MVEEKDLDIIDKIVKIDHKILKIYDNLINLELTNEEKEKEVNFIMIYNLKMEEWDYIGKLIQPTKAYYIVKLLERNMKSNDELYITLNGDERYLIFNRIIQYLLPFSTTSNEYFGEIRNKVGEQNLNKNQYKEFYFSQRLTTDIIKDNQKILINNLNEEINILPEKQKLDLIKYKYLIFFQNPILEDEYSLDDYKDTNYDFVPTKMIYEIEGLKKGFQQEKISESYDIITNVNSYNNFNRALQELMKYDDIDLNDKYISSKIIFLLGYLKTMITFINIKTMKNIRNHLDNEKNIKDNQMILSLIKDVISTEQTEITKNKHRIISITQNV